MKSFIVQNWLKLVLGFLVILLSVLYWKKDEIAENKYTKAKMEIFKAALEKDTARIKEVLDSFDF